jgi:NAD(P)H dehydrogenase (quinone)
VTEINKYLVVLAAPEISDPTAKLCKLFIQQAKGQGVQVDLIDLYREEEFNPYYVPGSNPHTKILEYQIRVNRCDTIFFFTPLYWYNLPGVLKSFIDSVFSSGFAYKNYRGRRVGVLRDLKAYSFCFSSDSAWKLRFLYRNMIDTWWSRVFFDTCQITGKCYIYGNLKNDEDLHFTKTLHKISKLTNIIIASDQEKTLKLTGDN